MVSFVHPGINSLVSFGSGVFCPTFLLSLYKKSAYAYVKNKGTYQSVHLHIVVCIFDSTLFNTASFYI